MSDDNKDTAKNEALKKIADIIGKYVKSGSKSNMPVNGKTGKIRTKQSNTPSNHHENIALIPEELYEIIKDSLEDDTLPPELMDRLKKLKQDIENTKHKLTNQEIVDLNSRIRATENGKPLNENGFTDAMKNAAEEQRKLRQELGTEILNAIEQSMEEQEKNGDDGEEGSSDAKEFEKGLDDEDGDEESSGGDEDGEDGEDEGQAESFEEGLEEGEGEDAQEVSYGEDGGEKPESAFDLGKGEVNAKDVEEFSTALEMIMSRQADSPSHLPKWNKRELAKRNMTFRNPLPAKQPVLQQQDVVFVIDDSGSMNQFMGQANTLAKAIFESSDASKNNLVVTTSCNGEYNSELDAYINSTSNVWLNGSSKGLLPKAEDYGSQYRKLDHALRWKWWLEEFLPQQMNVQPKIVIFFSDSHGAYQWNYLSNNVNGITFVWLDPNNLKDESYTESNQGSCIVERVQKKFLKEWLRDIIVKGFAPDDGFTADERRVFKTDWNNIPLDFKIYRGKFFSGINSISDIIQAIKTIANI